MNCLFVCIVSCSLTLKSYSCINYGLGKYLNALAGISKGSCGESTMEMNRECKIF